MTNEDFCIQLRSLINSKTATTVKAAPFSRYIPNENEYGVHSHQPVQADDGHYFLTEEYHA